MKNGNYVIKFSKQADKDKKKLKNAGLEGKAKELLNIIQINPFQIPPKYEKLQGDLSGLYSIKINQHHSLVYEVLKEKMEIHVMRMWTHYENL